MLECLVFYLNDGIVVVKAITLQKESVALLVLVRVSSCLEGNNGYLDSNESELIFKASVAQIPLP